MLKINITEANFEPEFQDQWLLPLKHLYIHVQRKTKCLPPKCPRAKWNDTKANILQNTRRKDMLVT